MLPIFMFPGQGSQSVGMGKDLFENSFLARKVFEEASDTLHYDMAKLCFEDPEGCLNQTEFTQPALLTVEYATWKLFEKKEAAFAMGHSLGEYGALCSLGALSFSTALLAVRFRGQEMQKAVPVGKGSMVAYIGSHKDTVITIAQQLCVEVANFNSPQQIVFSGEKESILSFSKKVQDEKLGRMILLPVSAPFHSSLMRPAEKSMEEYLEKINLNSFPGSIVANYDAAIHSSESYKKSYLTKQISHSVLWEQSLNRAHEKQSDSIWIEVGPGQVLQGLVKKTLEHKQIYGTNDFKTTMALLDLMTK